MGGRLRLNPNELQSSARRGEQGETQAVAAGRHLSKVTRVAETEVRSSADRTSENRQVRNRHRASRYESLQQLIQNRIQLNASDAAQLASLSLASAANIKAECKSCGRRRYFEINQPEAEKHSLVIQLIYCFFL